MFKVWISFNLLGVVSQIQFNFVWSWSIFRENLLFWENEGRNKINLLFHAFPNQLFTAMDMRIASFDSCLRLKRQVVSKITGYVVIDHYHSFLSPFIHRGLRCSTHWGDMFFFKFSADQIWYSSDHPLRELNFRKILLKFSRELCFWPWLNLYIMNHSLFIP